MATKSVSGPPSRTSRLFRPLKIGHMTLQHRVVMAPLTRFRASDAHVPLVPLVPTYYAQRASTPGTLLISEATFITARAGGYANVPGIWNAAQIAAWREVTDAVHAQGSYMFLQLWALGRTASPAVLQSEGGFDLVSSSPVPLVKAGGGAASAATPPRELSVAEIEAYVADYAQAATNAVAAGFDGVELHGANGYLIDQFIQDKVNRRTDGYGGSVENRSRFAIEVVKAVVDAVGAERVGIRLSPFSTFQGMKMDDPIPQFTHLIKSLKQFKLAYIHVVESRVSGIADIEATDKVDFAIDAWDNTSPVLIAGGFGAASALRAADDEYPDKDVAIVFGRYFISNPDLPFRIQNGVDFNRYNRDTFYNAKSEEGYTDYPFSEDFSHAARL